MALILLRTDTFLEFQQSCETAAAALGAGVSLCNREHSLWWESEFCKMSKKDYTHRDISRFYSSLMATCTFELRSTAWSVSQKWVNIHIKNPRISNFFHNNAAQPTTFSKNSHSLLKLNKHLNHVNRQKIINKNQRMHKKTMAYRLLRLCVMRMSRR